MANGEHPAAPLDALWLAARLAPLLSRRPSGLVIAVSGGPDSIALMQLMAEVARQAALPPMAVATVDHGLRPGSGADAAFVLAEAAKAGMPVHLLVWSGPKPARALQERARAARYALLADCCTRLGADHLLTAHTQDDQAETVLFRLARGSGPAGLAGMQPITTLAPGVAQARPLIEAPKARLVATCAARGWPTRYDPSNDDPRFARTRLRTLLPALAAEGFDAEAFARLAGRLRRAEAAIVFATDHLGADAVRHRGPDLWELDLAPLLLLPPEFTIRLVGRALLACHKDRPVRLDRLERAVEVLRAAADSGTRLTRTLHGCLLSLSSDGLLSIAREGPRRRGIGPAPPRRWCDAAERAR